MARRSLQWPRLLSLIGPACVWQAAQAQIRVMSPASLVDEFASSHGKIWGSTATFGAPFYGARLLGRLVYGESRGRTHCTKEDYDVREPDNTMSMEHERTQVKPLHIVLVRRGGCSFVTKVKVAQQKGAHAVIIVDKEDSDLKPHDIRRIIVADDGFGKAIDIPSVLITRAEGQRLISAATEEHSEAIVELAWDVPTDHVVLVDLWMTTGSLESLKFLKEWAASRKALNTAIKFVPHYDVFGMESGKEHGELCWDEEGNYCAQRPDGSRLVTGKMVVEEDLRQLCIHEKYLKEVEYAQQYWDYVSILLDECPLHSDGPEDHRFGKACSERLMRQVGIDTQAIEDCATDTELAKTKLNEQRMNTAWSTRALRINGWRYVGALDADLVTRAICQGFIHTPAACKTLTAPIMSTLKDIQSSSGVGWGSFITSLMVISCLAFVALMFYKRSLQQHMHSALREEVMLEVQAQMQQYKQLS